MMNEMINERTVAIDTPFIRLDALMKLGGAVPSGGQAKVLIQTGQVMVNGSVCTMRGKKLAAGDVVQMIGDPVRYRVTQHDC